MTLARTFVLREPQHYASLLAFLGANWKDCAMQERPLQVRVSEYKATRKLEQLALMWVRLAQISEQAWIGGKQYSPEVWHEHIKRHLLPEETASGVKKWGYFPNDGPVLIMSTGDLNVSEFALYLTAIEAYAATELGLELA